MEIIGLSVVVIGILVVFVSAWVIPSLDPVEDNPQDFGPRVIILVQNWNVHILLIGIIIAGIGVITAIAGKTHPT